MCYPVKTHRNFSESYTDSILLNRKNDTAPFLDGVYSSIYIQEIIHFDAASAEIMMQYLGAPAPATQDYPKPF
jgi:hypothetical protein